MAKGKGKFVKIYQNDNGMVCWNRNEKCYTVFEHIKGRFFESFESPTMDEAVSYLKETLGENVE